MPVRPRDLRGASSRTVLHCGECVVDYPAEPDVWEWMFDTDLIVCEGCGEELVPEERTVAQ